jgi:small redox-active disulfide protein 2
MTIQVLGTGCPKCKQLTHNAQLALQQLGINAQVEKVESMQEIVKFKVMFTPALVVNGAVECAGRVPEVAEIVSWLATAAEQQAQA